ncbi:nucleotide exchange factor GrpE [Cupriavidus neocaledonicus]|uniref:Protein GrpE n=1 Tax=Cupriavidus neocaledonicus TaxID=1040979 RepID=A0A375H786_9BURK|nr:nucleotide exchange factor GrpE [Cupriavidus neocaledonicus]SOZ37534.1 Hsp 24 nucleotide exchange factor [Cupriavidus neocaledonicus]SPD46107.1 Protein GrpE [Cupriavidus neocaledonicus]
MEDQKQTPSNQTATPAGDEAASTATASPETGAPETAATAVDDVAAQLAALEAKASEHYDLYMRAVAEGENIRRRAQEDVAKAHKFAIENFADNLLPVMDSLQAALADGSGDIAKLREGVELTARQLAAAFERGKIVELNPVGEKFDPHRHQAISMVPAEQEPNTVVSVLQRGYTIADRVLRPALVTVAAPK